MKLYTSPNSPFGRMASIVAREHGIALVEEACNPFQSDPLVRANPLSFVPTLVLDDGSALYDSLLICPYLDAHGAGATLYPEADKWAWQTRMMLGHGLAEASVALRLQHVLPEDEQSATMKTRYLSRIARVVAALDSEVAALSGGALRMDRIAALCGLGHLEFRHGDAWRADHPGLRDWYLGLLDRPSVAETAP